MIPFVSPASTHAATCEQAVAGGGPGGDGPGGTVSLGRSQSCRAGSRRCWWIRRAARAWHAGLAGGPRPLPAVGLGAERAKARCRARAGPSRRQVSQLLPGQAV